MNIASVIVILIICIPILFMIRKAITGQTGCSCGQKCSSCAFCVKSNKNQV